MALTRKQKKAIYDREYRRKNAARLKAEKAAYFQRTYDPTKAAAERKKRMPRHIEYCRQPKYKAYKRDYDRQRRSKKFGEFADAHALLVALQKEIRKQEPDRFARYAEARRHGWSPLHHQKVREKRANERIIITESICL